MVIRLHAHKGGRGKGGHYAAGLPTHCSHLTMCLPGTRTRPRGIPVPGMITAASAPAEGTHMGGAVARTREKDKGREEGRRQWGGVEGGRERAKRRTELLRRIQDEVAQGVYALRTTHGTHAHVKYTSFQRHRPKSGPRAGSQAGGKRPAPPGSRRCGGRPTGSHTASWRRGGARGRRRGRWQRPQGAAEASAAPLMTSRCLHAAVVCVCV